VEPALAPIVANLYCLTKSAHPILEPLHYLILIIALIINHRSVFDSDWCCFVLVKMNASYDACLEIRSWYMHIYIYIYIYIYIASLHRRFPVG
jgi:hypothetical protein